MGGSQDIRRVQDVVAARFGVPAGDLVSHRRSRDLVIPRLIAVYLSRTLCEAPYEQIGQEFGGRDRTIVQMYCRTISRRMDEDADFASLIREVAQCIVGTDKL